MSFNSGATPPVMRRRQLLAEVGAVRPHLSGGAMMIWQELLKADEPLPEPRLLRRFGADLRELAELIIQMADQVDVPPTVIEVVPG